MNRKHLNRVISQAMRACKSDTTGRARLVTCRLNHARALLDAGCAQPARAAVFLALCAVRYGV